MGATFSKDSKTFDLKNSFKEENSEYVNQDDQHDIKEAVESPESDRLSIEHDEVLDSKIMILIKDFQIDMSPRVSSAIIGGGLHGGESF
jgi:hypothetical protein